MRQDAQADFKLPSISAVKLEFRWVRPRGASGMISMLRNGPRVML